MIKTNNHWRELKYSSDVPENILNDQFDYMENADTSFGFFSYRGHWYHLNQFMKMDDSKWHGSLAESAFCGVVVQLSHDADEIIAGYWTA